MVTRAKDNPFWDFSIVHYDTPGVASSCLNFQDKCNLRVNVLLYCLWLGKRGRLLEMDALLQSDALRQCSEQVLLPLRSARYGMKRIGMSIGQPKLYVKLKEAELEVERVEQNLLYRLAPEMPESNRPARHLAKMNLESYLQSANVDLDEWRDELQKLIDLVLEDKGDNVFMTCADS